jgi:transglutaminase-like putative cysteine protease
MRTIRSFLVLIALASALLGGALRSSAAAPSGYLTGPGDSYTFTINAGRDNFVGVYFTYPRGAADFWVKVMGRDGRTVLGDFDLDSGQVVPLSGGGTFYLTVYSRSGAGRWSTLYHVDVGLITTIKLKDGYLSGTGDSNTFEFDAGSAKLVKVLFSYPRDSADFRVKIEGRDHVLLGDLDLDKGNAVKLSGGGVFYLSIYSKSGAGGWSATAAIERKGTRPIHLKWRIVLKNKNPMPVEMTRVWLSKVETVQAYQDVIAGWNNIPEDAVVSDDFGYHYYYYEFPGLGPNTERVIEMDYVLVLKDDWEAPVECRGEMLRDGRYLGAEPLIESDNPFIIDLAQRITKNGPTACDKAKSIYEYVRGNITYEANTKTMMGALACLRCGRGDCNEFTDSIIALCRAAGIPARKGNGIYVFERKAKPEFHAFSEVYLPGMGWRIADATGGSYLTRSSNYVYLYEGESNSILEAPDDENIKIRSTSDGAGRSGITHESYLTIDEL